MTSNASSAHRIMIQLSQILNQTAYRLLETARRDGRKERPCLSDRLDARVFQTVPRRANKIESPRLEGLWSRTTKPGLSQQRFRKSRKKTHYPGNRWLKKILAQAAWAASHTKNTYLASQYRRVAGHRGKKRALIAVGHSMLVIFYHMMRSGASYADLGGDVFDRLEPERLASYYVKRLERLGHKVTLEPTLPPDLNKIFGAAAGGVYEARKTGAAFCGAEDRHVAPLEGGTLVA